MRSYLRPVVALLLASACDGGGTADAATDAARDGAMGDAARPDASPGDSSRPDAAGDGGRPDASLGCAPPADAASCTIYVDPTGDDSGSGASGDPFATAPHAVSVAGPGDTVCLRDGVYTGTVRFSESGAAGAPITVRNEPGHHPILDPGPSVDDKGVLIQAAAGHMFPIGHIVIEGLEIRNGHDGIKMYGAHDVVIRRNHIHDHRSQGILGNGLRVLVDANLIVENGPDGTSSNLEHGMYVTGSDWTVVNNVIYGNTAYGLQIAGYPYDASYHAGPEYAGASGWVVSNNTFGANDNRPGMVLWQPDTTDALVQNNVFYENTGSDAISFVDAGGGHTFRNNLVFGSGLTNGDASLYTESGTVSADPAFAGAASSDFHLTAGSPALDVGASEFAPGHDHDLAPRPRGAGIDLGAYERCDE